MARTPIHPGEHLQDELDAISMNAHQFALAIKVPPARVTEILRGRRGVTADTALRLARFFQTSPEMWLGLQQLYELRMAQNKLGNTIKTISPFKQSRSSAAA